MEPPSAPAASSPVAAAPSPPVTQGPRRRRRGGEGGGEGCSGLRRASRSSCLSSEQAGLLQCPVQFSRPQIRLLFPRGSFGTFPSPHWQWGAREGSSRTSGPSSSPRAAHEATVPRPAASAPAAPNPRLPETSPSFLCQGDPAKHWMRLVEFFSNDSFLLIFDLAR